MKKVGELHPRAKLKARDIPRIRERLKDGRGAVARLAREYGVDFATIRDIRDGFTWNSVKE